MHTAVSPSKIVKSFFSIFSIILSLVAASILFSCDIFNNSSTTTTTTTTTTTIPNNSETRLFKNSDSAFITNSELGLTAALRWLVDEHELQSEVFDSSGNNFSIVYRPDIQEIIYSIPSNDSQGSLELRIISSGEDKSEAQIWETIGEDSRVFISSLLQKADDSSWLRYDGIIPTIGIDSSKNVLTCKTNNLIATDSDDDEEDQDNFIEKSFNDAVVYFSTYQTHPVVYYGMRIAESLTNKYNYLKENFSNGIKTFSNWVQNSDNLLEDGNSLISDHIEHETPVPNINTLPEDEPLRTWADRFSQAKDIFSTFVSKVRQKIQGFIDSNILVESTGVTGNSVAIEDQNFVINDTTTPPAITEPVDPTTTPDSILSKPIFIPVEGIYEFPIDVSLNSEDADALIYYTIDGSIPTDSTGTLYESLIHVSKSTKIRAVSYKEGYEHSPVASAYYEITGTVSDPIFNPINGLYYNPQTISISCLTQDSTIRYTLDGSQPTHDHGYIFTEPFIVLESTEVKAIAYKSNWSDSAIISSNYKITGTVSNPEFSIPEGIYLDHLNLSLSCSTPGATIIYTKDESNPSNFNGSIYSQPLEILETSTIKAIALMTDWKDSIITSATYIIKEKVSNPTANPIGGVYHRPQKVTLLCSTEGAEIRYTLDNTIPTTTYGIIYTSPIIVSSNVKLNYIAYRKNWLESAVITTEYDVPMPLPELVDVPGGTFIMGTDTEQSAWDKERGMLNECPSHLVTLSSFKMSKYLITNAQFGITFGITDNWNEEGKNNTATMISFYLAAFICNELSRREGLQPVYDMTDWSRYIGRTGENAIVYYDMDKNGYRLPTEAEWEYVARWGDELDGSAHDIRTREPNGLGIFGLDDNLSEICQDYSGGIYTSDAQVNPTGPEFHDQYSHIIRDARYWPSYDTRVRLSGPRLSIADTSSNSGITIRIVRRP